MLNVLIWMVCSKYSEFDREIINFLSSNIRFFPVQMDFFMTRHSLKKSRYYKIYPKTVFIKSVRLALSNHKISIINNELNSCPNVWEFTIAWPHLTGTWTLIYTTNFAYVLSNVNARVICLSPVQQKNLRFEAKIRTFFMEIKKKRSI